MASMTDKKLDHAIAEAYRFITLANDLVDSRARCEDGFQSKKSGAVRRSSMDLTRALATLRSSANE